MTETKRKPPVAGKALPRREKRRDGEPRPRETKAEAKLLRRRGYARVVEDGKLKFQTRGQGEIASGARKRPGSLNRRKQG